MNRLRHGRLGAWGLLVDAEFQRFPDLETRAAAIKEVHRAVGMLWFVLVVPLPLILLSENTGAKVASALLETTGVPSRALQFVLPLLLYFVLYALAFCAFLRLRRDRVRRILRARLNELGIPTCLHCGYDLRGQTTPRCPECGRPFNPELLHNLGDRGHRSPETSA